ncbi:hypothetical protein BH10ACT7_BH10ACT7_17590 [soil metagenome]
MTRPPSRRGRLRSSQPWGSLLFGAVVAVTLGSCATAGTGIDAVAPDALRSPGLEVERVRADGGH